MADAAIGRHATLVRGRNGAYRGTLVVLRDEIAPAAQGCPSACGHMLHHLTRKVVSSARTARTVLCSLDGELLRAGLLSKKRTATTDVTVVDGFTNADGWGAADSGADSPSSSVVVTLASLDELFRSLLAFAKPVVSVPAADGTDASEGKGGDTVSDDAEGTAAPDEGAAPKRTALVLDSIVPLLLRHPTASVLRFVQRLRLEAQFCPIILPVNTTVLDGSFVSALETFATSVIVFDPARVSFTGGAHPSVTGSCLVRYMPPSGKLNLTTQQYSTGSAGFRLLGAVQGASSSAGAAAPGSTAADADGSLARAQDKSGVAFSLGATTSAERAARDRVQLPYQHQGGLASIKPASGRSTAAAASVRQPAPAAPSVAGLIYMEPTDPEHGGNGRGVSSDSESDDSDIDDDLDL